MQGYNFIKNSHYVGNMVSQFGFKYKHTKPAIGTERKHNFNQTDLNKPEDDITYYLHDAELFVKKMPLFALPST